MLRKVRWEVLTALALFIAFPAGLWFYRDYTLARALARELEALRASGAPLAYEDLVPAPVPDEENAALLYEQARLRCGNPVIGAAWDNVDTLRYRVRSYGDESLRRAFDDPNVRTTLELLHRAARRPQCVLAWDYYADPDRAAFYGLYSFLRKAGGNLAACGGVDAAHGEVDDALRCYNAA